MEETLFHSDPCYYLPHRPPFLFIDRILSLDPGVVATGEFAAGADGYIPPVLLVEAMAQMGGIAAGQRGGESGVLAALQSVQLPPCVERHARIFITARVMKMFGQLVQIQGEAREGEDVIASAGLTLAIEANTRPLP